MKISFPFEKLQEQYIYCCRYAPWANNPTVLHYFFIENRWLFFINILNETDIQVLIYPNFKQDNENFISRELETVDPVALLTHPCKKLRAKAKKILDKKVAYPLK